uniref:Uncharacterized protein n=1 Tax=Panagrolaimus sp. ES5 TaxID=591445 RepID=A0AC34FLS0_9BILA
MSVSKECIASQWLISIKDSNLLVFPYTIEIIFETPGHEGNLKQLILSKNKNNEFKQFCRAALNMIDIFHGVSYAYDGRTKLWSPTEIIADEMNFEWIQPNLPPFLQQRFQNPDGILKVKIQPGNDILLSDFPKSVNGLIEDRTWRNIIEVVLSEHAITRVHDRYIMLKSGKMFEIEGHPFERGLVWREGNKKG